MLYRARRRAHNFDILHFHTDYLHFPLFADLGNRTVTTLHGRLDLADLPVAMREFSMMPLVSISNGQRRPMAVGEWLATVHHGIAGRTCTAWHPGTGEYFAFSVASARKSESTGQLRSLRRGMKLRIAAKVDRVDQGYLEREIEPLLDDPIVEFVGEIGEGEKSEFIGNATALLFPIDWPEPSGS